MLRINTPVSSPLISIRVAEIWHHGSSPRNNTVQWSESQWVPLTFLLLLFALRAQPTVIYIFLSCPLLSCSLFQVFIFEMNSKCIFCKNKICTFLESIKNEMRKKITDTMMKKFFYISLLPQCRAAFSLILEGFDDSSSGNEDVIEATDDEEIVFVPLMNRIILKQNWSMRVTKQAQTIWVLNGTVVFFWPHFQLGKP